MRIHGCTVHFVTPELDAGPIIAQAAVPVLAGDTEGTLVRPRAAAGACHLPARSTACGERPRLPPARTRGARSGLGRGGGACFAARRVQEGIEASASSWPGLSWPSRPKSASCWDARHKAGHDACLTDPRSGERGLTPLGGPELPGELRAYPLQRHAVVVERRAAIGRDLVGAGERVDAAAIREIRRSARSIPRSARRAARPRRDGRGSAPRRAHCAGAPSRRSRSSSSRASAGWIITSGRRSFASDVGVSLKVELRNCRAGLVASRNGCSSVASSIAGQ